MCSRDSVRFKKLEENEDRKFKNRVLRTVGPTREVKEGGWRGLQSEEFHFNKYC
jgi:hypothetical protein